MSLYDENVKALAFYRDIIPVWAESKFYTKDIKPANRSEQKFSELSSIKQVEHCLWMTIEMQRMLKETQGNVSIDKLARWLGFIQATLIINGLTEISAERERTRPWFKDEK
jgi:hypothetical protein